MPQIDLSKYETRQPRFKMPTADNAISNFFNRDISFKKTAINDKKKEYLFLELSSLLRSGIDMRSCFDLIIADQRKPADKQFFVDIKQSVLGGESLSRSLAKTLRFSSYEIFSLQIGEESGKLIEVLEDLAKFYNQKIKQRRKIVSALTYPVIVLSTSLGAVFFMLKFVVPMFGDVFKRFGGHLPWITQKIIDLSQAIEDNTGKALLLVITLTVIIYNIKKKEKFREIYSDMLLRLPLAGNLIQKIYLARFCNAMRLLINARVPLIRAIALIKKMISFYPIEASLTLVEDDITRGMALHQSLQQFKIYPPKMIQLIKIGEETNQLDYFFARISDQYVEEIEYKTSTISSAMEPVIIIFLGVVVGIILISMYLPLFQMSNSF